MGGRGGGSGGGLGGSDGSGSNRKVIVVDPVSGKEYECLVKERGGIKIYYTKDSRSVSGGISRMIGGSSLPGPLKGQVDSILIVPDVAPDSEHTIAIYDDHSITVYQNQELDAGEFAHEAAHGLAESLWGSSTPPPGSEYRQAIDSGEPPVSAYGGRNPAEDFSEAVRMYVEDPDLMQDVAPLRYAAVRHIM